MKLFYIITITLFPILLFAQTPNTWKKGAIIFTPELLIGKTMESNEDFPRTRLQWQSAFGIGRNHKTNPQEWAHRLKGPKTALTLIYTDLGNLDSLGVAISAMPSIEFNIFKSKRLKMHNGIGITYFTKKHHPEYNLNNKAVTTHLTWAYRMNFYYDILTSNNIDWRMGLSYSHHSNGHTKLMNQGYNSFLLGISADVKKPLQNFSIVKKEQRENFSKSMYSYYEFRAGIGQNVFSTAFNNRKDVYTISGEYGHVFNKTFKLGLGVQYRFYQHYYDYIKDRESLVQPGREFDFYVSNPWYYASNLALNIHGEIMMNHIGIDLSIGYNIHKPAYKIDWRINQGWENPPRELDEKWVLGEYSTYYHLKQKVSARLGLKYYWYGTDKSPKNNYFFGMHLNSNLGQADFSELSIGYVYSFRFR